MIAYYSVENTALRNDRVADLAIDQLGTGQITRSRIYRVIGEEIELRHNVGHVEVGIVKGADRSDILPISVKKVRLDLVIPDCRWNDLAPKVSVLALAQHCSKSL